MSDATFADERVADLIAAASLKPRRSGRWRQCERCHGRGGVPETTTLDGVPTGRLMFCPVCLGLGRVATSAGERNAVD